MYRRNLTKSVVKLLIVTLLLCLSLGLRHSSAPRLSLVPLLTNTLPGPSASEVTTLWRYTNLNVIIFFDPGTQFPGNEKLRYAVQKSAKIKLE